MTMGGFALQQQRQPFAMGERVGIGAGAEIGEGFGHAVQPHSG
jgi:hypothetical protein